MLLAKPFNGRIKRVVHGHQQDRVANQLTRHRFEFLFLQRDAQSRVVGVRQGQPLGVGRYANLTAPVGSRVHDLVAELIKADMHAAVQGMTQSLGHVIDRGEITAPALAQNRSCVLHFQHFRGIQNHRLKFVGRLDITDGCKEVTVSLILTMTMQTLEMATLITLGAGPEPHGGAVASLACGVICTPGASHYERTIAVRSQEQAFGFQKVCHRVGRHYVVALLARTEFRPSGLTGGVDLDQLSPNLLELDQGYLGYLVRQPAGPVVMHTAGMCADGYELIAGAQELDHTTLNWNRAFGDLSTEPESQQGLATVGALARWQLAHQEVADEIHQRLGGQRIGHIDVESPDLTGLQADAVIGFTGPQGDFLKAGLLGRPVRDADNLVLSVVATWRLANILDLGLGRDLRLWIGDNR